MPGSLPNPVLYFPAKFICYSVAGWALKKIHREGINPFLFGILRVVLGFGVGILLIILIGTLTPEPGKYGDYVLLLSTRLCVWAGMIWIFYERKSFSPIRFVITVVLGIAISFGIDATYSWVSGEFPGWLMIGMC